MDKRYRNLLIFFLIVGLCVFAVSFYVQYGISIPPCTYCRLQRWGYFLLVPLAITGLASNYKKFTLRMIQLLLLLILIIAGIHTFKEFFGTSCSCQIGETKWQIFGITVSFYSALFSIFLISLVQFRIGSSKD